MLQHDLDDVCASQYGGLAALHQRRFVCQQHRLHTGTVMLLSFSTLVNLLRPPQPMRLLPLSSNRNLLLL